MDHNYTADLQKIWDRLRVLALTLIRVPLEEGDAQEIGSMIEDIIVDRLQPVIDALKRDEAGTGKSP